MICPVFGFVEKYLVVSKSEKGEGKGGKEGREGREGRKEGREGGREEGGEFHFHQN